MPGSTNIDKLIPELKIDAEIKMSHLNKKTIYDLNILEPFGEENECPIFLYRGLKIDSIRALTDGKHLKMTLKDENIWIDAIGFNMGELSEEYLIGEKIDVACMLEINSYNNVENIQLNIKDMRRNV